MKKIIFLGLFLQSVFAVSAQNYDPIKILVIGGKFKDAKVELDKNMTNAKFTSKPDAYMLKAMIYAALSLEEAVKNTTAGDQLNAEAYAAFKKYLEMDATKDMVTDPIYREGPINIYNSYSLSGYNDYTKEKWDDAAAKFKKAVEISDLMIAKKVFSLTTDTTIVYLSAVTAQNAKRVDDALTFYKRLADIRLGGPEYENMYKYMVYNYFLKKDFSSFEKYKAQGLELYPKTEYFTYDKLDFAYDLATSFDERLKMVEEVLAAEPNNYKGSLLYGQIIFDTLHPRKEGDPIPANAAELETKMIGAFNKAATINPAEEMSYLYLGDHFYSKAEVLNEARTAHASDMKTRTKPGAMASKDDITKRDLLDRQFAEAQEVAREPYEKAAGVYEKKTSLELRDKQQYKKVANFLAEIYSFKRVMAKGKPADQAKWAAEEKKWNDRYDTIK